MVVVYLLILAAVFVLEYFIAKWFFEAAEAKGYHEKKYFWICFWFGWIGYLLVIALPDRGNLQKSMDASNPAVNMVHTSPVGDTQDIHSVSYLIDNPVRPSSGNSWVCKCGRKNANYVSSCVCGRKKHDCSNK